MGTPPVETEIKLALSTPEAGRKLLQNHGFEVVAARLHESNALYDTTGHSLREKGIALRLRVVGGRAIVTQKGPAVQGRHKSREENEVDVSDSAACARIFEALGFRPAFRYEKFRTTYQQPGRPGHALLDETPIGCFLELEGEADWIDEIARQLGFSDADYITGTYVSLYLTYCESRKLQPGNMLFQEFT